MYSSSPSVSFTASFLPYLEEGAKNESAQDIL